MKTIYIDSDFKCHVTNIDNTYQEINTDFFDNKCDTFIEGYRFIPINSTWVYKNMVFNGEMIIPWKPYRELEAAQREYERQQLEEYKNKALIYESNQTDLNTSYQEGINSI